MDEVISSAIAARSPSTEGIDASRASARGFKLWGGLHREEEAEIPSGLFAGTRKRARLAQVSARSCPR